jgi:mRNA interferase RelE/StbE
MPGKYQLEFDSAAQKEWKKLDAGTRSQLAKKLAQRLVHPRVQADKLHGLKDCYKIKLRSIGYRLVYQVIDQRLVVYVISVGRRDDDSTYGVVATRQAIAELEAGKGRRHVGLADLMKGLKADESTNKE